MSVDPRQLKTRKSLDELTSGITGVELDDLLTSINKLLTKPLRMRSTGTHTVTIDSLVVKNDIIDNDGIAAASGAGNDRSTTVPPIDGLLPFSFAGATITIPATNNNNITQTTSGGSLALNITVDNYYKRIGVSLLGNGNIILTAGAEAAALSGATAPAVPDGSYAIGHFVVQRSGANIANMGNGNIVLYSGGGGGGSGSGGYARIFLNM